MNSPWTIQQAVRKVMGDLERLDTVDVEATTDFVMSYELQAGATREQVKAAVTEKLNELVRLQEAAGQG